MSRSTAEPFALQPVAGVESPWARVVVGAAAPVVERALGLHRLGELYHAATGPARVDDFPERALAHLGITWQVDAAGLAHIPAEGPLVVVANHPFGAADGLVLLALVRQVRRDVRLLGNVLLQRIPEMADLVIGVDPFGARATRAANRQGLRKAVDWARRGGAVIVFPAGEVSAEPVAGGRLIDPPWKRGVATIIQESHATAVPVYFEGRNSVTFEIAGRVHPALRTALLAHELLRRRGANIHPVVGRPIGPGDMAALDPHAIVRTLRAVTYGLRPDATLDRCGRRAPGPSGGARRRTDPESSPIDPDGVALDVAALPPQRILASSGDLQVLFAAATEAPALMREIGRLREITFRAAGEGTGRAIDVDRFDAHYLQLVVWHRERREVVGGYRIGRTDRTPSGLRAPQLYTRTLFDYGPALLQRLGPALELGRSFVRPEYQREFAPLMLLWQGIARYAARHPRYRTLFGPVSISADYHPVARDLMVAALEHQARTSPWAALASARRPCRTTTGAGATSLIGDASSAHELIKRIDDAHRGLPVLLRQYLKLGATPLAVSVDPDFSDAIDALMVVELDRVPPALLSRYMGAEGVRAFGLPAAAA